MHKSTLIVSQICRRLPKKEFNEKFGHGTIDTQFVDDLQAHLELENSRSIREVAPDADGVRRPMGVRGHTGNSEE